MKSVGLRKIVALVATACVTFGLAPGSRLLANSAPAEVTAQRAGSETVQVTWSEASGAAGYLITPVVVLANNQEQPLDNRQVEISATQFGHLFENLSNGTTYVFRVKAVYANGVSSPKDSNPIAPAGAPGVPRVSIVAGDSALTVSWDEAAANGSPILGYQVNVTSGAFSRNVDLGPAQLNTSVTGLTNETLYTVQVTASNLVGSTSASQSGTPTLGVTPPSAISASAGMGSVTLAWTPPTQLGGGVLDGYEVEATVPSLPARQVDKAATSYTWTGLTAGTTYTFRLRTVTALNAKSAWSVTVQATPLGGADSGPVIGDEDNAPTERIGGMDRYQTSVLISEDRFAPGVSVVYLANGSGFADALSGGPATGGAGPVLLVTSESIPASTKTELRRLEPGRVVVLGGESAISASVMEAARSYTTGSVTRIGGSDRFETAAQISQDSFPSGASVVFVATGSGFADALAAGPAALGQGPVLLVRKDSIPSSTTTELSRLNPGRIVVLGGESVVSTLVLEGLRAYSSGEVVRLGGNDRYSTSVLVSSSSFAPGVDRVFIATGTDFADALSAGPIGAPVLLSKPSCVPQIVLDEITRLSPTKITVLGGSVALSSAVRNLTPCG